MQLTPEGTNARRLSSKTLCSAVSQVRSNGFVLFERVPSSEYQDAHPDIFSLFAETPIGLPKSSVVVNIPLVRLEAIGATETEGPELAPEQFYGAH